MRLAYSLLALLVSNIGYFNLVNYMERERATGDLLVAQNLGFASLIGLGFVLFLRILTIFVLPALCAAFITDALLRRLAARRP